MVKKKALSKSKYVYGIYCKKYVWLAFHDPEKIPSPDAFVQQKMEEGNLAGDFAKKLFPDGVDLADLGYLENIEKTKQLLKERKIIFEAGILADRLFSRADILVPVGKDEWDVLEVKASTKVKREPFKNYIEDLAFQKYCYEKAGLKIRSCFLVHLNKDFMKDGGIDPEEFFVKEDVTSEVDAEIANVPVNIEKIFDVIENKSPPERCENKPGACPVPDVCWGFLPKDNVFELSRIRNFVFDMLEQGILSIKEIPEKVPLHWKFTTNQSVQIKAVKSGKPVVDKQNIKQFLESLEYPMSFLDFETFSHSIPLFDSLKAWQNVPFQFSLHVVQKDGSTEHFSFLADGPDDPRKEFFDNLKKMLPKNGSVVVYNQTFEKGRLQELGEFFKETAWTDKIIGRLIDLEVPFRKFYYYHPEQHGKSSIKKVLPALTGKGYEDLDIAEGGMASTEYLRITYSDVPEGEKKKVREDLEKYCALDTEAMIWILDKLKEVVV